MKTSPPSRVTLLVPALICLAVAASLAIQVSRGLREDFYWTPEGESRPLGEARDRVEVYVDGELVQRRAAAGRLLLRGPEGEVRELAPEEITARLNEFDRVTRGQVVLLTAALTAGVVLLAVGFLLPSRRRGA